MQIQKISFGFLTLVVLLWLSACASTSQTEPDPGYILPSAVDNSHHRAKLIIGSNELRGMVALHSPKFRTIGQLTQAQVELENYSGQTLDLEYRIDWSDLDGFKAGTLSSWQFVSLAGNGTEALSSTGKVPEATRITVTVRLPGDMFESLDGTAIPEQY